jgi:hypothetical protein
MSGFNYVSIGKQGFVLVNVKPTVVSQLENIEVPDGE